MMEKTSSGPSLPMQPTEEPQLWPRQLSQASCATSSPSNCHPTWKECQNRAPSLPIKRSTLVNTHWLQQPWITGTPTTRTITSSPWKRQSRPGSSHVTNSPKTPSSPQVGMFQPFTPSTLTSAWSAYKTSSLLPEPINPKETFSGSLNPNWATKCSTPGKVCTTMSPHPTMSPSQSTYGTINTPSSTKRNSLTSGKPSSQELNLSVNGEESCRKQYKTQNHPTDKLKTEKPKNKNNNNKKQNKKQKKKLEKLEWKQTIKKEKLLREITKT
jgi:hypothetical protein